MKFVLIFSILILNLLECFSQTPKKAETVNLNGINIYYEVYGTGEPLFLLHGFTLSSKSWLSYIPDYENSFEVYLVDLRGHGKSSLYGEKISIRSVASDVNALAEYLKLDSINAIGFSHGGLVLFQLALLHPGLIKSMITVGVCGSWRAKDFPDFVKELSYKNIENLPWMREQQTNEEQIKSILAQLPNIDISVSDEELKSIQTKTLLLIGDRDQVAPLECVAKAKRNLPNSFLWVLPNAPHGAHEGKNKAEFVRISKEFFSGSWSK